MNHTEINNYDILVLNNNKRMKIEKCNKGLGIYNDRSSNIDVSSNVDGSFNINKSSNVHVSSSINKSSSADKSSNVDETSNKSSNINKKCAGCYPIYRNNQIAHMDYGGCLYRDAME